MHFQEDPAGIRRKDSCAVDLTEVYSRAFVNDRSTQLGLSTEVPADLGTGWDLETKSRRDKCSSELRNARPKVLIASQQCPLFLKSLNRNDGNSIPLESGESKVITTRSHLICAVRECFEQMHRGDHFTFEHRTRRLGKICVFRSSLHSQVFLESMDPCVAGICCQANPDS